MLKEYMKAKKQNTKTISISGLSSQIVKIHKEKEYFYCNICDYKTTNKYRLIQHTKIIHSAQQILFKCELCSYETKYKLNLP